MTLTSTPLSKPMSQTIRFYLELSYDEFTAVYTGQAKNVITKSFDGRTVRFPANILKPYLTRTGIKGTFAIHFDNNNKFQSLELI